MHFVENSKAVSIISDEAVQAALAADQGKEAKLESWESVPFTKKGDNYVAFITSIQVKFKKGNRNGQISFVAKINPCRPIFDPDSPDFVPQAFEKEIGFYLELLPELNHLMNEFGQKTLPFPKCYYAQYGQGKQMLIFEDLRLKEFKMMDRSKGLDFEHALLVIQGLGHLHAASSFMLNQNSIDDLKSKYPFLFDEFWSRELIETYMVPSVSTGKEFLAKIGGHEVAINWLDMQLPGIYEFFERNHASFPPFNAICHGDCWTNNILFRHNEDGLPVEVMLLDIQLNRFASLANDLKYFMFSSLDGPTRKPNISQLLKEYYSSFRSIIEGCGQDLPFTEEELVKEYKKKNDYGLLYGTFVLPIIVMGSEDEPDSESIPEGDVDKAFKALQQKALASLDTNPFFKPRFVAIYDEMLEEGLFS